ncbi:MAG: hypothetical protein AAFX50_07700 [Acidobacteriota bacterium]
MHDAPLHERSVDAVTDYFARRPLVSEPWEKKYRLTSQRVERHYWVTYLALLPFALLGAAGWVFETAVNGPFTAVWFGLSAYAALAVGLIYAVHVRR